MNKFVPKSVLQKHCGKPCARGSCTARGRCQVIIRDRNSGKGLDGGIALCPECALSKEWLVSDLIPASLVAGVYQLLEIDSAEADLFIDFEDVPVTA